MKAPHPNDFLHPAKENLSQLISRVGDIIKNIDNKRISESSLEQSVLKILEQYRVMQQLQYRFLYRVKGKLPIPVKTELYLIVMELLQNTIKHARATAITLKIWQWRDLLFFYYTDNGVRPALPMPANGLGLQNLQHRIEHLGGMPEYPLHPRKSFQFHIPLQPIKHESQPLH